MTRTANHSTRPSHAPGLNVFETAGPGMQHEFEAFVGRVRGQVEGRLRPFLDDRVASAERLGPDVAAVADSIRQLTLRGGKRTRAILLAATFEACGDVDSAAVVPAGVALELLQSYLLAHDDWMDGDDVRRGGPSVPALMRSRFGARGVDAMSVLAGDLAAAWARQALLEVPLTPSRVVAAARELARVEEAVVSGQVLDVCATACNSADVERVHALKTASYSVRGPVVMGALLAGAAESQVAALVAFSEPLGVAFQLRDDLLGVFGDPIVTGKPTGSDLRSGKQSAVVVDCARQGRSEVLDRVIGHADATDDDVRAAVAILEASGARARVERRIDVLVQDSRGALNEAILNPRGRALLSRAVDVLTQRQS